MAAFAIIRIIRHATSRQSTVDMELPARVLNELAQLLWISLRHRIPLPLYLLLVIYRLVTFVLHETFAADE